MKSEKKTRKKDMDIDRMCFIYAYVLANIMR